MSEIGGVLTAMVTPFDDDGAVDYDATRRLARHLVDEGCHGLVIAGTTGESATVSDEEKVRLFEAALDEVGDSATVIAGTGSNDTAHTAELTRRAHELGVDAVLVVTPYYNRPNEAGLRAHFAAASEAAGDTPVIVYNIPSRSVVNLSPELLAELAATHENIVGVKQANNEELGPIDGLAILAGNDAVFARTLALRRGGRDPRGLQRRAGEAARALRRSAGRRARARGGTRPRAHPALRGDERRPARRLGEDGARAARRDWGQRAVADGPGLRHGTRHDPRDARGPGAARGERGPVVP